MHPSLRGVPLRVPHLVWDRRHNVATLTVSFGLRAWDTKELCDLLLGYNAVGRLSRVIFLNPRRVLPSNASEAHAARAAAHLLARTGGMARELAVLRSARLRAEAAARGTEVRRSA